MPRIPLVSNLTGAFFAAGHAPRRALLAAACARAGALRRRRRGARRAPGRRFCSRSARIPTLLGLAGRAAPTAKWTTAASLRRGRDDQRETLSSLGSLYVAWGAGAIGRRSWRDGPSRRVAHVSVRPRTALVDRSGARPPKFQSRRSSAAWDAAIVPAPRGAVPGDDHERSTGIPGATCGSRSCTPARHRLIELAMAAARSTGGEGPIALRALAIESPLRLEPGVDRLLHTDIGPETDGSSTFIVRSAPIAASEDTQWQTHAKGIIQRAGAREPHELVAFTVGFARERCHSCIDVSDYYERLHRVGLSYGRRSKRCARCMSAGTREWASSMAQHSSSPWSGLFTPRFSMQLFISSAGFCSRTRRRKTRPSASTCRSQSKRFGPPVRRQPASGWPRGFAPPRAKPRCWWPTCASRMRLGDWSHRLPAFRFAGSRLTRSRGRSLCRARQPSRLRLCGARRHRQSRSSA